MDRLGPEDLKRFAVYHFIITAINMYCVTDSKQFRLDFFTVLHNYKIMPYIDENTRAARLQ